MKYNPDDIKSVRYRLSEMTGKPWLVKESIKFIEEHINKDSIVLEFGAGASTVWFAERAKKVYSFETNKVWWKVIKEELLKKGLSDNVALYYGNVEDYLDNRLCGEGFSSMLCGDEIDLALIDYQSPSRFKALKKAVEYMKTGGYLVLDNSNRVKKYAKSLWFMGRLGWKSFEFYGTGYSPYGKSWKTTIWRK